MQQKIRAGIIGATGRVGQRFLTLLAEHPYFEVTALMGSGRSAGKRYADAVQGRWKIDVPMPVKFADMVVRDAADVGDNAKLVEVDVQKTPVNECVIEDKTTSSEQSAEKEHHEPAIQKPEGDDNAKDGALHETNTTG